jgi:hypothetical protein
MLITQSRSKKKSKRSKDNSNGTRRSCLGGKSEYKKSQQTVPLRGFENPLYYKMLHMSILFYTIVVVAVCCFAWG